MINITDKSAFLSTVDLFSELTIQEINELAEGFYWENYSKGSYITRQGQNELYFYILAEGKAEVFINRKGRDPLSLNSFSPGDIFGEIALITGKNASANVRCLDNSRVLVLDSNNFSKMLIRWPKLYEKLINSLSEQLNQINIDLWEAKHKEFLRSGIILNQLKYKFYDVWGSTKTTNEIERKIDELAKTNDHIIIIGERGTGQQMLAWHLHKKQFGERAPFIVLDGKQLDKLWGDLILETHEHISSLPIIKNNALLDIAEGGTLFIRDFNLISPRVQLKLATSLDSQSINCRIIGGLLDDPEKLTIKLIPQFQKHFKTGYKFTPLRERKKDILVIAKGILERLAKQNDRTPLSIDKEATKLLLTHHYRQANVTELIEIIERAFFLAAGEVIGLEHLFFGPTAEKVDRNLNLLSWNWIAEIIKKGIYPLWIQRFSTIFFVITLLFLFIEPTPNIASFSLIVAWGLWWPSFVISSSLLGRFWCGICPISYIMELVQKVINLNRPVPDILKKYDYLITTILFLIIFWIEAITEMRYKPLFTGTLIFFIVAFACIIGIIYTRHTWCRYICPLGGFIGMASISGVLEVRADSDICLSKCTTHECFLGTEKIEGCPMSQFAPYLDNNLGCKLCLRCIRNCPNDAVRFNLRFPAREIWHLIRINQGFVIFVGVTLAILFPINYFEPLHRTWPQEKWQIWFTIVYWSTALLSGLLTWAIAKPFKTKAASKRIKFVFALIPIVVAGYVAYQLQYTPGAENIIMGFGYKGTGSNASFLYIPALKIGQIIAAILGIFLTITSVIMIILHSRKKSKSAA